MAELTSQDSTVLGQVGLGGAGRREGAMLGGMGAS